MPAPDLPGITLDISQHTYRELLATAARECDVQTYWVLLKNGADPLLRFDLPEPETDDYSRYYWEDDDWDYGPAFVPREEDTILFLAARHGCAEIVEHLLGQGEDPEHKGKSRKTALEAWVNATQGAEEHCHWARVGELLLEAGCNPKADRGYVWRMAAQQQDGKAKQVLLAWEARKRRNALDAVTPEVASTQTGGRGRL